MNQAQTAEWTGYDCVDDMNAEHDQLHAALCQWLGLESASLRIRDGEILSEKELELAAYEEDAVLHVQRFQQMVRKLSS